MPDAPEAGGPAISAASINGRAPGEATAEVGRRRSAPRHQARLSLAAATRGVPLATILVSVAVVVGVFLLGQLAYRLRTVLLLILIASFLALILNPLVLLLQKIGLRRRGLAVTVVVLVGALCFLGLAAAFGYPMTNGVSHLSVQIPGYVADAEHGRGVIGRLVQHFHLQQWVSTNAPKLHDLGTNLAKPALAVGKGALTLLAEMLAVFTLVALLLLEGPRMRAWLLGTMPREQAEWWVRVGGEVRRAVVGYVLGSFLTSLIAGVVVGVTMAILGLPFPLLWALWVALVDFLPQVGGALAGIPTVLFALVNSPTDGIILAVVFLSYQELENHVLNPWIMSRTVRTSPLLIFLAVLIGGSLGGSIGGAFGAFAAAVLAVPVAASMQIVMREIWQLTAADAMDDAEPLSQ